jgi:hypothetical protein
MTDVENADVQQAALECDSNHPANERVFDVPATTILRSGVVLLRQKRMRT